MRAASSGTGRRSRRGSALGRMARELMAAGTGAAIASLAEDGSDPNSVSSHHVGEAARAGDREARNLLGRYADNVALGLAGLCNILDPAIIVISGPELVVLGELLLAPVRAAFLVHIRAPEHRPAVPIVPGDSREARRRVGAAARSQPIYRRDRVWPKPACEQSASRCRRSATRPNRRSQSRAGEARRDSTPSSRSITSSRPGC